MPWPFNWFGGELEEDERAPIDDPLTSLWEPNASDKLWIDVYDFFRKDLYGAEAVTPTNWRKLRCGTYGCAFLVRLLDPDYAEMPKDWVLKVGITDAASHNNEATIGYVVSRVLVEAQTGARQESVPFYIADRSVPRVGDLNIMTKAANVIRAVLPKEDITPDSTRRAMERPGNFLLQEYIDGAKTLDRFAFRHVREERISFLRNFAMQLLWGLATLHACNTVHGDLNWGNIMIRRGVPASRRYGGYVIHPSADYILTLIDLGGGRIASTADGGRTLDFIGAPAHYAPVDGIFGTARFDEGSLASAVRSFANRDFDVSALRFRLVSAIGMFSGPTVRYDGSSDVWSAGISILDAAQIMHGGEEYSMDFAVARGEEWVRRTEYDDWPMWQFFRTYAEVLMLRAQFSLADTQLLMLNTGTPENFATYMCHLIVMLGAEFILQSLPRAWGSPMRVVLRALLEAPEAAALTGRIWEGIDDPVLQSLLEQMLKFDPKMRFVSPEIMDDPAAAASIGVRDLRSYKAANFLLHPFFAVERAGGYDVVDLGAAQEERANAIIAEIKRSPKLRDYIATNSRLFIDPV